MNRLRLTLPIAACFAGALILVNGVCYPGTSPRPPVPDALLEPRYVLDQVSNTPLPAFLREVGGVRQFVVADTITFLEPQSYRETTTIRLDSASTSRTTTVLSDAQAYFIQVAPPGVSGTATFRLPAFVGGVQVPFNFTGTRTATISTGDGRVWQFSAR